MTHYPDVRVTRRTTNPLVLIAEVREALRRAGVARPEIHRFSSEAFADLRKSRQVCSLWVQTSRP